MKGEGIVYSLHSILSLHQSTRRVMVQMMTSSPRRRPVQSQNPSLAVQVQVQVQAVETPVQTRQAVILRAGRAMPTVTPRAMQSQNIRSGKRRNLTNPTKTQTRKLFQR